MALVIRIPFMQEKLQAYNSFPLTAIVGTLPALDSSNKESQKKKKATEIETL